MGKPPIRVLLVEDDPVAAVLFEAQLRADSERSFEVDSAASLAEAERHLAGSEPDVIALDLTLPDSGGLDTLERIRQAAPDTPVVVLTGLDRDGLEEEARSRGAAGLLTKGRTGNRVPEALRRAATGS